MQARLLYHLRSLIAADLAGVWSIFGGLAAQLNYPDIAMNVAITDSASMALSYGRPVREFFVFWPKWPDLVTKIPHGVNFLSDFLPVGNPAMKLRALAERPSAAVPTKVPNKEPTARQTKKEKETERNKTAHPLSRRRPRPRSVKKSAKTITSPPPLETPGQNPPRRKPPVRKGNGNTALTRPCYEGRVRLLGVN